MFAERIETYFGIFVVPKARGEPGRDASRACGQRGTRTRTRSGFACAMRSKVSALSTSGGTRPRAATRAGLPRDYRHRYPYD